MTFYSESPSDKNNITIKGLNEEQIQSIKDLFQKQNWLLDIEIAQTHEKTSTKCAEYFIPPSKDKERCPYCFCQPCITSEDNHQAWWCTNIEHASC